MFPTKVKMIIISHLSDIEETEGLNLTPKKEIRKRINFIKYLVMKFPNTNEIIDVDKEFDLFLEKHPQFKL